MAHKLKPKLKAKVEARSKKARRSSSAVEPVANHQGEKEPKLKRRRVRKREAVDRTAGREKKEGAAASTVPVAEPESMDPLDSDDYFEVLGLTRAATATDVKRAYRKLAVQWHPDKNRSNPRAEEFFKKISEAYEVLSDPDKRALYENYGQAGLEAGGAPPRGPDAYHDHFGVNGRAGFSTQHARDIFDAFFGGVDPFEAFFSGGRQRDRRRRFGDDWGQSPFEGVGLGMHGFGGMGGTSMSMMDSFFNDGFGGMGSMGSMGGGGFSTSMSSSSSTFTDQNGHTVMQKTTTTVGVDGRSETVTEEFRNGLLVNSTTSSSSSRLAEAGRMQLEGGSSQRRVSNGRSRPIF
ncbi:hypothetical protein BBJ28_00019307 [Nothophytophthora sp. Chile5]|nr:hypothetical protein BBJ28_00019307 [Nothophytophthora sp. Chile5]